MPVKSWKDLMEEANESVKGFAPLENAHYSFVVKDAAKLGQTGKGHPKFSINPSVESGPRENARIWHDFNVTDSGYAMKKFFFDDLAALGLGPSFFDTNPSPEQIAQALQGRRFVAEVYDDEGNDGVTRKKLRNFSPPVGAAPASAQAGVPQGLPVAAAAPASQAAPAAPAPAPAAPTAQAAAPASPWDDTPAAAPVAPAPPAGNVPMPPVLGN